MTAMVTRIGGKRPYRVYLREWRQFRGLTQEQLADRIDTNKENISRWETRARPMDLGALSAVAEGLDVEVRDLFRRPDQPSADDLLRNAPESVRTQAIEFIGFLTRKTG